MMEMSMQMSRSKTDAKDIGFSPSCVELSIDLTRVSATLTPISLANTFILFPDDFKLLLARKLDLFHRTSLVAPDILWYVHIFALTC